MKLHLIDAINNKDIYYDVDNKKKYYEIWEKVDAIIDEHNYSCTGFAIPKIDTDKQIITIHWIELFGTLSTPYIEIVEYTDNILQAFNSEIKRCLERGKKNKSNKYKI